MFIFLQVLGYFLFLLIDSNLISFSLSASFIKYMCVLLCLLYVLYRHIKGSPFKLQIVMLLLVSIADFFLLFTSYHNIGVMFFGLLQCSYSRLLYPKFSIIEMGLIYIMFALLIKVEMVSVIYGIHSLTNFLLTFMRYCKTKDINLFYVLLSIGLLILCDIHVALQYLNILKPYQEMIYFMIWVFYVPSLWCLVRSYLLSTKEIIHNKTKFI